MLVKGMIMHHQANAPSLKEIFPELFKRPRRDFVQEGETAFIAASHPVKVCSNLLLLITGL